MPVAPTTPAFGDLEIRIFGQQDGAYPVEFTLDGHIRFERGYLDPGSIPGGQPTDGAELFAWFVADERVAAAWDQARARRPQRRIRLVIDADAPELHALAWESLRDQPPDRPAVEMAGAASTPFSRYLAGTWQPGRPVLSRPIRILVAIASPEDLADFGAEAFDIEEEWQTLAGFGEGLDVEIVRLPQPCTLTALNDELRNGYHILHLVAHGVYQEEEDGGHAYLLLCDGENRTLPAQDVAFGEMLARQMTEADERGASPLRLVFLDSCSTATRDDQDARRGFAPVLVQAGVPAVIAMQEKVSVSSGQLFARTFYERLLAHGLVDLACNEARATLLTDQRADAGVPVLFMRLLGGLLFARRGEVLGQDAESFWEMLLENIELGECIPILGPDVSAHLLPSPEDLALELVANYGYPFDEPRNLPQVAQFFSTIDERRLRMDVLTHLVEGFQRRLGLANGEAAEEQTGRAGGRRGRRSRRAGPALRQLIADSGWIQRSGEQWETEIHQQLADLELPLYLTVNPDTLLESALEDRGRAVRSESVDWRALLQTRAGRPQWSLEPPPTPEEPVVLHLFGTADDPRSLVLTEDDFLDYLTLVSQRDAYLLPTDVSADLAEFPLLFLGFQLDDLHMKVILRGLLAQLNLAQWGSLRVAVQTDVAQADDAAIQEVLRFIQKSFAQSGIDVYLGDSAQFMNELHARWLEMLRD